MSYFVGIDLGTTNSAISTFDGKNVRIWKSPEQNDVTPSAIYVDRRGNRYYGMKAYNQAPYNPQNSATLFKRFMGTNQKMRFAAANLELSPEECSAEILKVLYGYLPEEIRSDPSTCTVITVPAAFNQMKKDATLQAARLAGIGKVALMQEPVAAIMSIMRVTRQEGIFLVYDMGGGTFDLSIAENIGGKVNLLAHGGVEMCGGRDIDRSIFQRIVIPWLRGHFSLPADFQVNPRYSAFCRIAQWAAERAKIELSSMELTTIALSEGEARTLDEDGNEMYLDIDLTRQQVDELMEPMICRSLETTREILHKAGLTSADAERVVFVGGPTVYKPLRDRIAAELALPSCIDVNPMTAVAEGAGIFAESIDWTTTAHNRKASNCVLQTQMDLTFRYTARTPDDHAKVLCVLGKETEGFTIQVTSMDTGWSSGRAALTPNKMILLPLHNDGMNRFSVEVCDSYGNRQPIGVSELQIVKTLATVGAIPASHTISLEVAEKLGGTTRLEPLVHEGDSLPKKGIKQLKAGQTLRAGSADSINLKLWEGEIEYPITDNRFIGVMKITGHDLESGIVPTGADIECEYEISDSGAIRLEVSIPCIGASFSNHNFYSRQEGQTDLTDVGTLAAQGREVVERIDRLSEQVSDSRLDRAREMAAEAAELCGREDPEEVQRAGNELLEARRLIYRTRQENLKQIRQTELNDSLELYQNATSKYFEPADREQFNNLIRTAQRDIDSGDSEFDYTMQKMMEMHAIALLRQDWVIVDWYQRAVSNPADYMDAQKFRELKCAGDQALAHDDIDTLRGIFFELKAIQIHADTGDEIFDIANVIKG